jgi:hypothetical protein
MSRVFRQGRPLNATERALYLPYFQPRTLQLVRIIEGYVPFWLSKRMCAVVLGHRIYFRYGLYQSDESTLINAPTSLELMAHELTHVEQYLSGMTIFKYLWASRHGYRRNPYETDAYSKGAYVCAKILSKNSD